MPVTLNIANHPATEWKQAKITTPEQLLEKSCLRQYRKCKRIVQGSLSINTPDLNSQHISSSTNGFVWAAYHAYSAHHHLILRPEDIWFAILTQLSFFITAHAEDLRSFFVAHSGQRELEVFSDVADFGAMSVRMTELIAKNVVDPQLGGWVMPSFTTTTESDRVVGAVLFMGAMQAYFSYKFTVTCGLPSVTLLGEIEDWREIRRRIEKLDLLGDEAQLFARMLRPILDRMVLSFEDPTADEVLAFWNTIVHHHRVGSGTDYLSGWLAAFCFWSEEGVAKSLAGRGNVLFGDVLFPTVDVDCVPVGYATVPVKVDHRGCVYDATMVAGSVGICALASRRGSVDILSDTVTDTVTDTDTGIETSVRIHSVTATSEQQQQQLSTAGTSTSTSTDERPDEGTRILDTIQPLSGWWILENEGPDAVAEREGEMKRLQREIDREEKEMRGCDDEERFGRYCDMLDRLEMLKAY